MVTMYKILTLCPGFGAGRGGQLFWRGNTRISGGRRQMLHSWAE